MIDDIKYLFFVLSVENRFKLILLLVCMVIGLIFEIFSIALILPFLTVISDVSLLKNYRFLTDYLDYFSQISGFSQILVMTILFVGFSILNGLFRMFLLWFNFSYIYKVGAEIGQKVFNTIIFQPMSFHTENSSSVSLGATRKVDYVVDTIIKPLLQGLASAIFAIGIVILMLTLAPEATSIFFCVAFSYYAAVSSFFKSRLNQISRIVAKNETSRISIVQEALGSIRDVIIDKKHLFFIARFSKQNSQLRFLQGRTGFLSLSPRYLLEALGMSAIALIAYIAVNGGASILDSLPILGLLAISAQKLLPLIQQVYVSWSSINASKHLLSEVIEILQLTEDISNDIETCHKDVVGEDIFNFSSSGNEIPLISVKNLKYRYPSADRNVLNGISLNIARGESIGLIGETGSGKSTLIDLIMGLNFDIQGRISIGGIELNQDNCSGWHKILSHVPQAIYLLDATIAENIALGEEAELASFDRIVAAAKKAKLDDFVMQLGSGYETRVGERGVKLSGGQRQRIGIARALYKGADVLVFDEATSALDSKTENLLIRDIAALKGDITILMIAHRLSTLSSCDRIIELQNGVISWTGSYDELVGKT
jgi:ATP-binding cassette subfamily B protein